MKMAYGFDMPSGFVVRTMKTKAKLVKHLALCALERAHDKMFFVFEDKSVVLVWEYEGDNLIIYDLDVELAFGEV